MNTADPRKHSDAGSAEKSSQTGRASNALSQFSLPNRRDFLLTATAGFTAASLGIARAEGIQTGSASGQQDSSSWATYWSGSSGFDVDNLKRSFVPGRDYFVLRSGHARLFIQADQASIWPGFLWLGFDSRANKETQFSHERRKENAVNFDAGRGFLRSALEVLLGGFPFTALAHETETQWVWIEGIPAVEAQWWAGGLLVTEHFFAADSGLFVRRITLSSQNLGGTEEITLRLSHPEGESIEHGDWLVQEKADSRMALGSDGSHPRKLLAASSQFEIGPLILRPGESVSADSWLSVAFPPEDEPWATPANVGQSIRRTGVAWSSSSSVTTEDATVREIFDKARAGLSGLVSDDGSMDNGVFEYGAQWVRDTSATLTGLLHAGHFDLARAAFVHLLNDLIDSNGRTMVASGFEDPDREELDQMGGVLDALRSYVDWTGDDSLVREYRSRLVPMIERPLQPEFRHANGMVHNRREYWEREFDDGFELIYQVYVALGLRRAASLAEPLGAMERAPLWRQEAARTLQATLHDPVLSLVEDGRLIKRRSVSGERVRFIHIGGANPDVPVATEKVSLAEPDTQTALAIALGVVDPHSLLARNSLDDLEKLWNARWFGGGYERYHSSAEPDQPGPWTFPTCFLLRAQHDAGLFARSRRSLEWLNTVQGGRSGAWFEEIPIIRSQAPTAGILPWVSAEVTVFVVRHMLGVRFEDGQLLLRPTLYPGSSHTEADLRFRQNRLKLEIQGPGPFQHAVVNGRNVRADVSGSIRLGRDFEGGRVSFHA